MTSFGIEGNKRHGKNVLSTALGIWIARRAGNIPLWSNYTIFGYPYFNKYDEPSEILKLRDAVLIFDELGTTTDARTTKSEQQILFTHKFAQMEKDGITFIYTCQRPYLIEKRVREQTDYVIQCYKHPLTGRMTQTWFDTSQGRDNKRVGALIGKFIVHPEQTYRHFDTFEHVESNVNFNDMVGSGFKQKWKPKNKWKGGDNI